VTASLVLLIHVEGRGGGGGVSVRVPERRRTSASLGTHTRQGWYVGVLKLGSST